MRSLIRLVALPAALARPRACCRLTRRLRAGAGAAGGAPHGSRDRLPRARPPPGRPRPGPYRPTTGMVPAVIRTAVSSGPPRRLLYRSYPYWGPTAGRRTGRLMGQLLLRVRLSLRGGYWGGYYRHYNPNEALGAARLQVSPRETEVFVDGYFAGVVDDFDGISQRLRLEPGEHEVTLFLEGHRPLTRRCCSRSARRSRCSTRWSRSAPASRPRSGRRRAPSRRRPRSPATGSRDRASTHRRSVGGHPAPSDARDVDVEVIGREPNEPREPREPARRAARGRGAPSDERRGRRARCRSGSARGRRGADRWRAVGAQSGERLVVALAPGVHRLEVRKGGHETYSGLVRIRPGGATTLNVALAPAER